MSYTPPVVSLESYNVPLNQTIDIITHILTGNFTGFCFSFFLLFWQFLTEIIDRLCSWQYWVHLTISPSIGYDGLKVLSPRKKTVLSQKLSLKVKSTCMPPDDLWHCEQGFQCRTKSRLAGGMCMCSLRMRRIQMTMRLKRKIKSLFACLFVIIRESGREEFRIQDAFQDGTQRGASGYSWEWSAWLQGLRTERQQKYIQNFHL